jgi:hypothetical protein
VRVELHPEGLQFCSGKLCFELSASEIPLNIPLVVIDGIFHQEENPVNENPIVDIRQESLKL